MPKFNVEFYKPSVQVNPGEPAVEFADVLQQIAAMTPRRRIRGGPDPAAILTLGQHGTEYIGEAARIRTEDLPSVVHTTTGNRHNLDIDAHEGLGEEIHFLYDSRLHVIAVQRKGHLRASALESLLSDLSHSYITFEIILRQDALERFDRMAMVKKVYFKLARPQDLAGLPPQPLLRVLRVIRDFQGTSAKVEISVGRNRTRQLRRNPVREVIGMFRERADNFKALSITGAIRAQEDAGDMRVETIDFIQGKLSYTAEVERRGRHLSPEGCNLALREAIRENREYLQRYRA
ncbi:MAG TPA: DUF6731 family protein [Candidatus Acidoferrum sp.]|nr:DUF6731 family protein [Candidatus Acidoferrum sp.]